MEEGISIDEACANNVIGTPEDFERNCNKDGTVKVHQRTINVSLKDSPSQSITIKDTHFQAGLAFLTITILLLSYFVIKKFRLRQSR